MKKKFNQTYFKNLDYEILNKNLPVNLKNLSHILNNIHNKYPMLTKVQIAMIIKSLIEEIREQLLDGNVINIRNFVNKMKLYTFCKLRLNKITFNTKIQVNTPERIKSQ